MSRGSSRLANQHEDLDEQRHYLEWLARELMLRALNEPDEVRAMCDYYHARAAQLAVKAIELILRAEELKSKKRGV